MRISRQALHALAPAPAPRPWISPHQPPPLALRKSARAPIPAPHRASFPPIVLACGAPSAHKRQCKCRHRARPPTCCLWRCSSDSSRDTSSWCAARSPAKARDSSAAAASARACGRAGRGSRASRTRIRERPPSRALRPFCLGTLPG
jgi:hypothetical protein